MFKPGDIVSVKRDLYFLPEPRVFNTLDVAVYSLNFTHFVPLEQELPHNLFLVVKFEEVDKQRYVYVVCADRGDMLCFYEHRMWSQPYVIDTTLKDFSLC